MKENKKDDLIGEYFGNLKVLEFVGYTKHLIRIYKVCCSVCILDPELNGDAIYETTIALLRKGSLPCSCAFAPRWTEEQYMVLLKRATEVKGYEIVEIGEYRGRKTKVTLRSVYGEWQTTLRQPLEGKGCPKEMAAGVSKRRTMSEEVATRNFIEKGGFPEGTIFKRSEKINKNGDKIYWEVYCPICSKSGISTATRLLRGRYCCDCGVRNQRYAYINLLYDGGLCIAIKFGITNNPKTRLSQHKKATSYKVENYGVWEFPNKSSCLKAETECRNELDCNILSKNELPLGYTETTYPYNIDKIVHIYERNMGFKLIE